MKKTLLRSVIAGVALLAAAGTGAYKNVVEACEAAIKVVDTTPTDAKAQRPSRATFRGRHDRTYALDL